MLFCGNLLKQLNFYYKYIFTLSNEINEGVSKMKYFQLTAFILETILLIPFILWGILYSINIIKDEKSWLNSGKVYKIIIEVLLRGVMFFAFIYWAYSSLIPRVMDVPKLVTGDISTVSGYAIARLI